MDVIPYRSLTGKEAWSPEVWAHLKNDYALSALRDCAPQFVVTAGADALWCLRDLVPDLAAKLPADWTLGDVKGQVVTAATEWGVAGVLPLPHLPAAFGVSRNDRAAYGRNLHDILSTSTREDVEVRNS